MNDSNNRRIAKNTIMLYIRMIFFLAISLYTSRVFLDALGVEDYGIYNVVGGVVSIFSIISSALYGSITRFISFSLGINDKQHLHNVFCTSVNIQLIIAVLICIVTEIFGLWFISYKMNISPDRVEAAIYVLHFSIAAFVLNIVTVPYNACIIAHEKMSAFAYLSIIEVILKLLIVYLLYVFNYDKLILYSFLFFIVALVNRFMCSIYCSKSFEECHYSFIFDKELFRKMLTFSGWNFIGSTSFILRDQGINLLINMFCGPAVNAARALSYRIFTSVQNFALNFLTAITPQITKDYANGNIKHMHQLMKYGSKLACFLLLIISVPIISQADFLLKMWLVEVPAHTTLFVQLLLLFSISEALSNPILTAIDATGDNKKVQLYASTMQLLNLPISWYCLYMGLFPEMTVVVSIFISHLVYFIRLYVAKKQCNISFSEFFFQVYIRSIVTLIISLFLTMMIVRQMPNNWANFILGSIISLLLTAVCIYFIGCNKDERHLVTSKITYFYHSKIHDKL